MSGCFGNGAVLKVGGTTFTELTEIGSPGYESDDIDVTTHSSKDYFMEFIKGLIDAGEIPFEGLADSDNIDVIEPFMTTMSIQSVTVTMPTTPSISKFECNGYVKSLEISAPHDGAIEISGAIKVTGKPTFSKG